MAYTAPSSEAHLKYYNKHAPERSMYSWVLGILQFAWAITDFKGIQLIIREGLQYVPSLQFLTLPVTVLLLIALHGMLFVSIRTYWFDELDDDEQTDSPIWIPLILTLILLGASVWGNRMLLDSVGHKAKLGNTEAADQKRNTSLARADTAYQLKVDRLNYTLTQKHEAIKKAYRDSIQRIERRIANYDPVKYRSKRRILKRQRSGLQERRNESLNTIQLANTRQLDTALFHHQEAIKRINNRHQLEESAVYMANEEEKALEAASMQFTNIGSIFIAVSFALLFWLVNYRYVRISVKSGIQPIYHFSKIQKRGGVLKWYSLAIRDILTRQAIRLAKWLHHKGTSGARQLSDLDGHFDFEEEINEAAKRDHIPYQLTVYGLKEGLNVEIQLMIEKGLFGHSFPLKLWTSGYKDEEGLPLVRLPDDTIVTSAWFITESPVMNGARQLHISGKDWPRINN